MQITVNQYSVAYNVGLSQLYDNQLNSSLQFRTLDYNEQNTARSTLTRGTRPDKIIFHSRQMQTCPTTYRRDDTLLPPPFPKTLWQMAVLAISSYFHFFRVFINNFFWRGHVSPALRLVRL